MNIIYEARLENVNGVARGTITPDLGYPLKPLNRRELVKGLTQFCKQLKRVEDQFTGETTNHENYKKLLALVTDFYQTITYALPNRSRLNISITVP